MRLSKEWFRTRQSMHDKMMESPFADDADAIGSQEGEKGSGWQG